MLVRYCDRRHAFRQYTQLIVLPERLPVVCSMMYLVPAQPIIVTPRDARTYVMRVQGGVAQPQAPYPTLSARALTWAPRAVRRGGKSRGLLKLVLY